MLCKPTGYLKVAVHCRNNFSLDEEEKPSESKTVYPKWRDVLNDKQLLQKLGITDVEKINGVYNLLESWITDFTNVTIQTLIQKILTESGILDHVLKGKDQSFELQLLNTFFDLVKEESAKMKIWRQGIIGYYQKNATKWFKTFHQQNNF
ncbi:MAG: hypothetical protein IPN97_04780 [Saprospiraceae bacterium]|nr:hypothetical protein [Saprospiraceae bacterium]